MVYLFAVLVGLASGLSSGLFGVFLVGVGVDLFFSDRLQGTHGARASTTAALGTPSRQP